MMPLHSPLSWTLVQHTVAPLTALVLLTAATVPEPPAPRVVAEPGNEQSADSAAGDAAATLEAAAVDLAHDLRAVPADDTERLCARDDLRVSWTAPTGFDHGAHVGTIGPAPDATTVEVNGAVVCGESTWAYMGFEAQQVDGEWQVNAVPYLEEDHGHVASLNLDADPDPHGVEGHEDGTDPHGHAHEAASNDRGTAGQPATPPVPSPSAPTARVAQSAWLADLGPIEPYAAYEPQRSCSPTVKAGMGVVRDTLLGTHPQTRNLGIVRACHIGGRSEHKEGRAFDWGAYVNRPVEKAAVDRFLTQLFATDAHGNTHALARRMGVMYVVWNGQIWASHRAQEGWRPYHGPNPHVDHVHMSLSWAGGRGQTSFFTQDLAGKGVLGLVPPGGTPLATDGAPVAAVPVAGEDPSSPSSGSTSTPTPGTTSGGTTSGGTSPDTPRESPSKDDADNGEWHRDPSPSPSPAPSPDSTDADHARREAEKEQRKAEEEQRKAEEEQRRIEEEQRRAEERELQRQEEQQRREADRQRKAEERQAEQQAASDETTTTTPGKGNGGGNGKGGGKGKR